MVVRAIIFDFAGVIASDAYWIWLIKTVDGIDKKKSLFQDLANKVDVGEISNKEFVAQLAKETGVPEDLIWPQF